MGGDGTIVLSSCQASSKDGGPQLAPLGRVGLGVPEPHEVLDQRVSTVENAAFH